MAKVNGGQPHVGRREIIYCDCCGDQPMADRVGDRLVIKRLRGDRQHVAVIILPVPVETGCSDN